MSPRLPETLDEVIKAWEQIAGQTKHPLSKPMTELIIKTLMFLRETKEILYNRYVKGE